MKSLVLSILSLLSMVAGNFILAGILCIGTVVAICIENREGENFG